MFAYEPLDPKADSLRVLTVLPGPPSPEGDVECELLTRTLRSKPSYEALSYTWGTQPASKTININGQPFRVRENLYNALLYLRDPKRPRSLWVDAICINQADIPERNAQVRLMAFIYTRAKRTLVWLGLSPWPVENDYFSDEHWHAVSHNTYWSRLWVVQEMVVPREVVFYLGRYAFGWDTVTSTQNPEWRALKARPDMIERMREERYTSTQRLEKLIALFQKAECSEKRDKIYGFLGLVQDGSDDAVTVDYNIPYAQLYAQVLDFHQKSPPPPDSSFTTDDDRPAKLIHFSQLLQHVLGGSVAEEVLTTDYPSWSETQYTVKGMLSGEILTLGPTHSEVVSSVRADRRWKQAIAQAYQSAQDLQDIRKTNDAFTRAILDWDEKQLGRIRGVKSRTPRGHQPNAPAELPRIVASGGDGAPGATKPRLFLGSGKLLGMAPGEAEVGDVVCTFPSCDVAVVVRKTRQGAGDRYSVVGRAEIYREQTSEDPDGELEDVVGYDTNRLDINKEDGVRDDVESGDMIDLRLDLYTIQQLTC